MVEIPHLVGHSQDLPLSVGEFGAVDKRQSLVPGGLLGTDEVLDFDVRVLISERRDHLADALRVGDVKGDEQ
ncbi:hypothetical protein D8S78_21110 [Natrialba swarupiae]|nr:hypothetical protein [Natrialba swarupiae]